MANKDYKEKYNSLRKKYALPELNEIGKEFEIEDAIAPISYDIPNILRFIRRSTTNFLWKWIDYLGSVII